MVIESLGDLMRAVATATFGGYAAGVDIHITNEHSSGMDTFKEGGFLIINVAGTPNTQEIVTAYVGCSIFGEWWFDADDRVMQVL